MLVFNTTYFVEPRSVETFLGFLREELVPLSLSDGLLAAPRLCRIGTDAENDGARFSLQFETADRATLAIWLDTTGQKAANLLAARFGERVLSFPTEMEVLPLDSPVRNA